MDEYVDATGYQVAEWANAGYHGGLSVSHKAQIYPNPYIAIRDMQRAPSKTKA